MLRLFCGTAHCLNSTAWNCRFLSWEDRDKTALVVKVDKVDDSVLNRKPTTDISCLQKLQAAVFMNLFCACKKEKKWIIIDKTENRKERQYAGI